MRPFRLQFGLLISLLVAYACDDQVRSRPAANDPDAGAASEMQAGAQRPEGVAACYTELSSQHPATAAFWSAFRGHDLPARAPLTEDLRSAGAEYPEQEEFALLHGLAHLWRLAEPLPEETADAAGMIDAALGARSELERAYLLCPTDHRIAAFLGPVLVNTGRVLSDPETIAQGLAVLQKGIDHYPAFVLFSKLLIFASRPRTDPDFQLALDALRDNTEACSPSDPACSNHPHAAHNVEGASVFLGDVLAKAGARSEALAAYTMAMSSRQFEQWQYRDLLEARIASLDERVAAFADDGIDDPESAWDGAHQCSICHRR
jgi:hypothetical protein